MCPKDTVLGAASLGMWLSVICPREATEHTDSIQVTTEALGLHVVVEGNMFLEIM